MENNTNELLTMMEQISDYAAMIRASMQQLEAAGLSREGAEAVLLNLLCIPGYESYEDEQ